MSEVSLGHIDTCGTHRVCLHATLSGGHLGSFTHDTPAWQTPHRHPTTGRATVMLTVGLQHTSTALNYTRVHALADCRYCMPDVRGQPGSYRHLWHPQGVPACHSDWGALRKLHTRHPSLADTTQASHNRQCHCSADSRPQGL